MFKTPLSNALGAAGYIFLIVTLMQAITKPLRDKPDTFLAPLTVLFVLTLSVAVMAFLFFYQPIQLFIAGKKPAALAYFAKTVGLFAVCTSVVLLLLLAGW